MFTDPNLSWRDWQRDDVALEFALYTSMREELSAFGWSAEQLQLFLQMQFDAQQRSYYAQHPAAHRHIVLWKNEPIGRLIVDRAVAPWAIVDVALLPSYRGRGLGSQLLRAVLSEAGKDGQKVRLSVWASNRARHLYERLGFQIQSGEEAYLVMEWNPPTEPPLVEGAQTN